MNRQRYEPVPQRDQEFINLDALANNAPYQYNTGLPNSVPQSAAPSYAAPSIRSIETSPPPSFHTVSRVGTPRANMRGGEGAELWGVATSTGGALTEAISTSNDSLETIKNLQQRVARLEESIGRLLLNKEEQSEGKSSHCCVSFTDASPEIERMMARSGDHCCVTFSSSKAVDARRQNAKYGAIAIIAVTAMAVAVILAIIASNKHRKGQDFDLS